MTRKTKIDFTRMIVTALMVGVTTWLHFVTQENQYYDHIVLRELYFLPILLGAFWFGLRGGLATSLSISALYLPLVLMHWQAFSPDDFAKILEMILFIVVAVVMGLLRDRGP